MRCAAYCTAASYNLVKLFDQLRKDFTATLYRDTIHIANSQEDQNIFFFSYGAALFWGLTEEEELKMLQRLKPFEIDRVVPIEQDIFDFSYGEPKVMRDQLILKDRDVQAKLAISYGLAQTTKLTTFELRIDQTIIKTRQLPIDLAQKGKIFLTRRQISKKIGELFLDRSSVNLHSDILDEPEFFWEHPKYHSLYRDTIKCFDLGPRVDVLNTRLSTLGDLWDILSNQLNHKHSSTLEWTIIWLILIEVIIVVLHDLMHLI